VVVLDTCALVDLASTIPTIGKDVMELIDDGAVILSISFAELACKIKAKKLDIGISSEELLSHYRLETDISIVDITPEMWHKSISLEWDHGDPADRMILSYAMESNLKIVTTDGKMKKKYPGKCIWKKVK
jgi:PIN domain nuclease of toxin-antitoxin system